MLLRQEYPYYCAVAAAAGVDIDYGGGGDVERGEKKEERTVDCRATSFPKKEKRPKK